MMCSNCSLCNTCMTQQTFVGNCTTDDWELLVIDAYSRSEDDVNGYPISNPQYRFLWELLNQVGVKYMVTDLVRCVPTDTFTRRYRKPTPEEYDMCFKTHILPVLEKNPPKAILMIGQDVVDYLVPGSKVGDLREKPHRATLGGKVVPMLATYHPYAAYKDLQDGKEVMYNRFTEDVVYACRHAFVGKVDRKTITITPQQFSRVVDIWCNDPTIEYVSYDTESNTLDPHLHGAKITSFSVAVNSEIGYNIMMYHPEMPEITDEDRSIAIQAAKKLLTTKKVVVQHAKHEHRMAKMLWGFTPNITDDTMYMVAVLYQDYPGMLHGLKFLAGRFAQMPPWEEYTHLYSNLFKKINQVKNLDDGWVKKLQEDYEYLNLSEEEILNFRSIIKDPNYYIKHEKSATDDVFYWLIPKRHLEAYAGMDAIAPLEVMKALKPKIDADPGFKRIYEMLMGSAEAFANMELKGLRVVDLEYWTERYKKEVDAALQVIRSYPEVQRFEAVKGEPFNPNSTDHNAEVFFNFMGFPVQGRTAKGKPSMSEDNLKALVKIYTDKEVRSDEDERMLNFLMNFRKYKKLNKVLSTYFIGLRRFMQVNTDYDGVECKPLGNDPGEEIVCIYPQYKLDTVATGRIASVEPSLHTLPTDSEVKKMFASHWYGKGGLILQIDYAAAEMRVVASFAERFYGDSAMADSFREGHDIHKFVASRVFSVPIEEVTSLQRRFSKSIGFAVLYGSTMQSVAESTGRSLQEVTKLFDDFFRMFPGVKSFIDSMHSYVQQYGCVRYPNGRIRHLRGALSGDNGQVSSALRQSVNSPVQGTASDCGQLAVLKMYEDKRKKGFKSFCSGIIHDALYIDVCPGEVFDMVDDLTYAMRDYPRECYDFLTAPLGTDAEIGLNMNDHCELKKLTPEDENGVRTFDLIGYDFIVNDVLEAMRFTFDVTAEEYSREEVVYEMEDIQNDHGVMSLTNRGHFTEVKMHCTAKKKVI